MLIDFENCPESRRFYSGNAGCKVGVRWAGANWMLKFPQARFPQAKFPQAGDPPQKAVTVPVATPLTEYLGSRVYEMLGIPVHETSLGIRGGKIVCACKDFTTNGLNLIEFHDLKNSLSDSEPGFHEPPSKGSGVILADVKTSLDRIPVLRAIPGMKERFWDMFVTDAFIHNADRDNTNWGILSDGCRHYRLAPVYDNGSSFTNRRTETETRQRLMDNDLLTQDAVDVRSRYTTDCGKPINPLKYMASGQEPECNHALDRFMERYSPSSLTELLDSLPEHAFGLTVLPDGLREYYKRVMAYRYERAFLPIWKAVAPFVG